MRASSRAPLASGGAPDIAPVATDGGRPRWSVMIPTHNCADLLAATLRSVLAQAPLDGSMHIEVVDDHSTADDPAAVVDSLGAGRVGLFRQPVNVGISANFTTCVRRSFGEWVHLLHGDDLVRTGFYQAVDASVREDPALDVVIVGCEEVDGAGNSVGQVVPLRPGGRGLLDDRFVDWLFTWNPIRTPAIAMRRSVYEQVGGFHPRLRHWADWDMWKRAVPGRRALYEPRLLASYRVHPGSDTSALSTGGADLREMLVALRYGRSYLPGRRGSACDSAAYRMLRAEALARLRHGGSGGAANRARLVELAAAATVRRFQARVAGRVAAVKTGAMG